MPNEWKKYYYASLVFSFVVVFSQEKLKEHYTTWIAKQEQKIFIVHVPAHNKTNK